MIDTGNTKLNCSQLELCYTNTMKCDFCENPKYVERINSKGILESFCTKCIEKVLQQTKSGK